MKLSRWVLKIGLFLTVAGSCTSNEPLVVPDQEAPLTTDQGDPDTAPEELFPDVLKALATQDSDGTWSFDVTLSSPYDGPARYADAWRVVDEDGTEYGIRILTHDHASEQPFTRNLSGIKIPAGVSTVIVQGRDQVSGWGGETVEVRLPVG